MASAPRPPPPVLIAGTAANGHGPFPSPTNDSAADLDVRPHAAVIPEVPFASRGPSVELGPQGVPSSAAENALGREAALLRSVQQAIRDPSRAFGLLDARFPKGALLVEARAARIIATCELQDRVRGRSAALEFARAWPNSPFLARLAAACGEPMKDDVTLSSLP
jgi:hypothetical protein